MDFISTLARSSKLGFATALGTASGVLMLCLVFQFVVPMPSALGYGYPANYNLNFRSLIIYATAGGVHLLLCTGAIIFFWGQLRRGEIKPEFRNIVIRASTALCIIFAIVLAACYFDMKIVIQSYDERLRPLQGDPRLAFLLAKHMIPIVRLNFQLFATFPLLLVLFGVAAAIMASFWISHQVIKFSHRANDLNRSDIVELRRSIGQLIGLTTVVFTASTIATISLMQIGRDWIGMGMPKDAYIQNGHAMSIFWSASYTTVTILIIILPLWWLAMRTRPIQHMVRHAGTRRTFYDEVFGVLSYKMIVQAGSATLAPLIASSMAAVFGS